MSGGRLSTRKCSDVRRVPNDLARGMVEKYHYSGNLPFNVAINFGVFDGDELLAVACYGPCVSRKAPADWLELRRLVRAPGADIILSSFLSRTLKMLRQSKAAPAVLSWADPQQQHHGGIYQATNWVYTEQKGGGNHTFVDETGKEIHPRTVYARYGTQSVPKILGMFPSWTSYLPETKHRYLYPLSMSKAACLEVLKTKERPYPKPLLE